jgi:hypothetical protein
MEAIMARETASERRTRERNEREAWQRQKAIDDAAEHQRKMDTYRLPHGTLHGSDNGKMEPQYVSIGPSVRGFGENRYVVKVYAYDTEGSHVLHVYDSAEDRVLLERTVKVS